MAFYYIPVSVTEVHFCDTPEFYKMLIKVITALSTLKILCFKLQYKWGLIFKSSWYLPEEAVKIPVCFVFPGKSFFQMNQNPVWERYSVQFAIDEK